MVATKINLPVYVEKDEDGIYVAVCPVFHVASQGDTEKEAIAHVKEALELFVNDEDVKKQYHDKLEKYIVCKDKSFLRIEINDWPKTAPAIGI